MKFPRHYSIGSSHVSVSANNSMTLQFPIINNLLDIWLLEDLGRGDLTTFAGDDRVCSAHWVAKQSGIFCSGPIIQMIFKRLDESVEISLEIEEGESFKNGQKILNLTGKKSALLAGERTSLNLAMHLSGIATATNHLVTQLNGTGVGLVDTRKTTPGLRLLEKYAFKCGGGINHRMGLDDAAMLKENHIAWSNGISKSVQSLRGAIPWTAKIIVEAETSEQAKEAVICGADGVLLDEMAPNQLQALVPVLRELADSTSNERKSSQIVLEASGIDPREIKDYAATGVDFISTSSPITKSHWIDFSMRFNKDK